MCFWVNHYLFIIILTKTPFKKHLNISNFCTQWELLLKQWYKKKVLIIFLLVIWQGMLRDDTKTMVPSLRVDRGVFGEERQAFNI